MELVTSLLDVLGVLLLAAGAAAAVYPLIGWACLMLAGVMVIAASQLAVELQRRRVVRR